jgi:hypothetical protein
MSGRRAGGFDSADTYGVRGAGVNWQARFGMTLNEVDCSLPRVVNQLLNGQFLMLPYDMFSKGLGVSG